MAMIRSDVDYGNVLGIINRSYRVDVDQVDLHRDVVGRVYFAQGDAGRYVFKLYRCHHTLHALNAIDVIQYLRENHYPVVTIVPTCEGDMSITCDTPEGRCVGILFEHVPGDEPAFETEIQSIGLQVGRLHDLMKHYPHRLLGLGKPFYIDRYISILKEVAYPPNRIEELDRYGDRLWKRMERLPRGFCHGDLHSGNMLQTAPGEYVLLDFDVASRAYSVIDIATLSDCTDFNDLNRRAYDSTRQRFEELYRGYSRVCTLGNAEIESIVDFIAIRHYEIIATILICEGLQDVSPDFLDEQYQWLLLWDDICQKKRGFLS